jgi:dihydroorotate dehydrogenase electron transfer subunit
MPHAPCPMPHAPVGILSPMPVPVDIDAEVLRNTHLSADYHVLELGAPSIARLAAPGQFVMVRTSAGTDPLLRRPFSLFEILRAADGTPRGFSLLIKRVGPGTSLLYDSVAGEHLHVLGPLGTGFTLPPAPAEVWMVAGGVGLAPFAMVAETLVAAGLRPVLYYGGRTAADLFGLDWFSSLGVTLVLATEDGSAGSRGFVTGPLERDLTAAAADRPITVLACGPAPMLKAVAQLATSHGRPSQVSTEQIMGCGLGGCYSCVVRVRDGSAHGHFTRSCVDGPVFNGDALIWE